MLATYLQHLVDRFIVTQEIHTAGIRIEYLKKYNEFANVWRESYGWKRVMKSGRAEWEEDAKDVTAQGEKELAGLDLELKRQQKLAEIERLKKERERIQNESADVKPAPPPESEEEQKARKKQKSEERIRNLRKQREDCSNNPDLSEYERRKQQNMFDDAIEREREVLRDLI